MEERESMVFYQAGPGDSRIEVRLEKESVWLSLNQIAALFDRDKSVVSQSRHSILYRPDGSKKIADNALVALTLMIAESKAEEKEMMTKVVVNLINLKN